MTDDKIPDPKTEAPRKSRRMRFSAVWFVPLFALILALGIVGQQYSKRGPLVEILFENGSGIVADSTVLKYRDVTVGKVEEVKFSQDLTHIIAAVRVDQDVAEYIDADAKFWLITPQVTTRGVSGLDTILSGVYIAGQWDSDIGETEREFTALTSAPLGNGGDGLSFVLRASNGAGVSNDTPIIYRGLEVGRISNTRLASDGVSVLADAFIDAPIDSQITTATRFWDTSGFNFSIGPTGAQLNVDSLATLLSGGVAFDAIGQTGRRVPDGTIFELYNDEDLARDSIFGDQDSGLPVDIGIIFDDELNGLTAGAAVEFRGIRIGEVSRLLARTLIAPNGDMRLQTLAYIQLSPAKMGLEASSTNEEVFDFLDQIAQQGVRAQLSRGGIFSGGLKIVFRAPEGDDVQVAGGLDRSGDPYPFFPSSRADIPDNAATAEGLFTRINNLPVEELLNSAINLLDSVNLVVNSPELREVPAEVVGILQDVRNVTQSEAIQEIPDQVSTLITSLSTSASAIESTLIEIQDEMLVESLVQALDAFANSAQSFDTAIAGLPEIVDQFKIVAENAANVPLDDLVLRTTDLLGTAEELIATDDAKAVPAALNLALTELSATLAELREGGVVENANATLASASDAADSISTAAQSLPSLVAEIEALVNNADSVVSSYQPNSQFNRDLSGAMRDLSQAAKSLDSLARKIERNPNSLLFGR